MNQPWLKRALPWAMYDWGNSAFATTVMAVFVPIFNKDYWSGGAPETVSTFRLSTASSIAAIIVAVLAPVLGAIADCGGTRKRFLGLFTALGVTATGGLALAEQGQWSLALPLYVCGWIGFSGAIVFYDSLLVTVADEDKFDLVSALGYSLGYIGGGLLLTLNVAMSLKPQAFGFVNAAQAVRVSFLSVAVWWALFSLPIFLRVREERPENAGNFGTRIAAGLRQLWATLREIRSSRIILVFLLAYWLYIDGVDTVIQMAVDYGRAIGLDMGSLITALLITQFVGFPAALLFGKLGEKFGAKSAILLGLAVYTFVCVWGYRMNSAKEFYVLAVIVGLVQGGVQSLSRSFFARLVPPGKSAEYFGFYNMLGKFAAILGPTLMGSVALATGNPRAGILAIIPLFVVGGALFLFGVKPAAHPSA
jgi:UMF1 family MFS transporter